MDLRQILLCTLSLSFVAARLNVNNVIIAIDCGSPNSYKVPEGYEYQQDDFFGGDSRTADYAVSEIILQNRLKYTLDPVALLTERHGENFRYDLPISGDGTYTLILKFVELYFQGSEDRVFDIMIGNTIVRQDFSILRNVPGRLYVHQEYIEVNVQNKVVFVDGVECEGGLSQKSGRLIVRFRQGKADLPKVDAIVLVEGDKSETDYDDYIQMKENWEIYEQQIIDQESKAKSQDVIEPINHEEEQSEGIFSLLFSPVGLFINGLLILFVGTLYFLDRKQQVKAKK